MVRLLFFLFSLLYTGLVAYCQELAGFQTQHFTTDNGMPSNGIKGMQWDEKTGFLSNSIVEVTASGNDIPFD